MKRDEKKALVSYEKVKAVKKKSEKALLRLANVVGVGVGSKIVDGKATGEFSVRVYVKRKVPRNKLRKKDVIPKTLGFVKTDVIEVGEVHPYIYNNKHRPAHGGDSVGHFAISSGTIGLVFRDKTDGAKVILSNNHILANRDTDQTNRASLGDCITQPGPGDGGTCAVDRIATLKRWIPFVENGDTKVDAAIAELINPNDATNQIHDIGCVDSWHAVTKADICLNPTDPDNVQKTGRTTEYTTGKIIDVDATIWAGYGNTYLTETIVTNDMAYYGDSGSLLVDMNNKVVGLLWGGSPGSTVYYSRIENVLDALNIEFYPCFGIIKPCLIGPRPPCFTGGPIHDLHCLIGPDIGVHCKIGGPDDDTPQKGVFPICLACGPDSPIRCAIGGPGDLIAVLGCKSGPQLIISIIDDKVNPKDIVIIDKTKLPKGMQKAFTMMLEEMTRNR